MKDHRTTWRKILQVLMVVAFSSLAPIVLKSIVLFTERQVSCHGVTP